MKKSFIFLILLLASLTAKAQTTEMFIESESKFGFDETVRILSETILNGGWKISIVHDLKESMKKADKDVLPVKVFELCNPKHSYKLLSKDDERIYSSLMPCRFSVYEKSDGKVYVSRMNSIMLSKQIGGLVEEVMTDAGNDTETFLKSVINR
ncbi:MAG: DUF302 domain-containing protein [Ignavibacteriae bacterium]|nr:DUF302 domain-containing protein [Ignavibacteriota bacterium]